MERSKEKITFERIIAVYVLCGFLGTLWEVCLTFYNHHVYSDRSGSILTFINPVYGFGGVFIYLLFYRVKQLWKIYVYGCLSGFVVEMGLSYLEEWILKTRSWDYSNRYLNILGRTTVPYVLFWGLLCFLVVFLVLPPYFKLLDKFRKPDLKFLSIFICSFLCFDLLLTSSAIACYQRRSVGKEPVLKIEKIINKTFDDDFMKKHFPNMRFANRQN